MITLERKQFFDTFGYLVLRDALSNEEVRSVEADFEAVLDEVPVPDDAAETETAEDGRPIFKLGTQWFLARRENAIENRPGFRSLLDDPRIRGTVEALLGPGCYRTGSAAKRFASGSDWHPDLGWDPHFPKGLSDPAWPEKGPGHYYRGLKAAIYLEPLTMETGCLRVIPGSHRSPYHEQLRSLHYQIPGRFEDILEDPETPQFGVELPDVPSFALESNPQDILFFSHQLWHAAFGGKLGRRMITWDYKAAPGHDHERLYAGEFNGHS
jgi:ectoine hydroxylase-related dioxygenase (phytanoyl-CoA dioxygenase family)